MYELLNTLYVHIKQDILYMMILRVKHGRVNAVLSKLYDANTDVI